MGSKNLTKRQVSQLAEKYLAGNATAEECALLHDWYNSVNPGNTETVLVSYPTTSQQISEEIFASLQQKIEQEKDRELALPRRSIPWRYATAAAILLLLTTMAIYFSLSPETKNNQPVPGNQVVKEVTAPHSARAVITLDNGEKLYLDSLSDGTIAMEGSARLVKKADGVVYECPPNTQKVQYHLLTVPRGSRAVNLTLSDGSRVWLNTESSIRYPVAFIGPVRTVEITGEAYFEVSKDPQRRFHVLSRGLITEVLGTHFNVNSYTDEPAMKVTLLEGSVHVKNQRGEEVKLKPGEQACAGGSSPMKVVDKVDTEAVIAWKNEYFMMKGTDISALARQMSRWYNIEVVFESNVPNRRFGGSISRNVNLSTMLKALSESGINSRIEDKKVVIL